MISHPTLAYFRARARRHAHRQSRWNGRPQLHLAKRARRLRRFSCGALAAVAALVVLAVFG